MNLFGNEFKKADVLKWVGDITQLGGISLYELIDGIGRGVRAASMKTPSGIDMTVLIDRGLDISYMTYKSIPVCWRSSTKDTSPAYYDSRGEEWLRTFFGGLLTTCGLRNAGMPSIDEGEEHGLHGRISNIGSELIHSGGRWENDDYIIEIAGRVREAKVFGDKLELERKITAYFSKPKIIIEDRVENLGFSRVPLMILYHVNIGYPVVDSNSKLVESEASVTPRDDEAKKGFTKFNTFSDPVSNFKEQVYLHDIKADSDGNCNVAIINEEFNNKKGIGIWLKYNKESLPYLIQWKQMGEGDYVCGIEPANCLVSGRAEERKKGNLRFIDPGEVISYRLEINVLEGRDSIESLKNTF